MTTDGPFLAARPPVNSLPQVPGDILGIRWLNPVELKLTHWGTTPPQSAGLYFWASVRGERTILFNVVDRGDGILAVKGNSFPIDRYNGYWIGPINRDCEIITERTPRHMLHE